MKKILALTLVLAMTLVLCCGCGSGKKDESGLDTSKSVALTICGPWTSVRAMEEVTQAFGKKYPNCTVEYEYLQNYEDSIVTRLESNPETVDLFISTNIQQDSAKLPYALELFSQNLRLDDTNEALIKNFTWLTADTKATPEIYCIPMGGELRGLYVNKTLLQSVGIDKVPENAKELLEACRILKDAGYVPMNGNPGVFGQRLMYPYVCNLIANAENYQETYDRVNSCEPGVSELFREPMQLLYTLMENDYYNYKYVENELNMFTDTSDEGTARDFFNIVADGDDYAKLDDVGRVAFMSGALTQRATMDKCREDYHSAIEYEFVMAPVSAEGGYAYVSPGQGIAVNKNSANIDWALEFLSFFFQKDVNTEFANGFNYIPNTSDSFSFIKDMFNLPENHISDLGQATFDYDFFNVINDTMIAITKGNNPKYMNTDADGNTALYSFDYYMDQLEAGFTARRESMTE